MTSSQHDLLNTWTLWAHLPDNPDWSLEGYIEIYSFKTLEEAFVLFENIPNAVLETCWLFLMRQGITPRYEDVSNKNGGTFVYKVSNSAVPTAWQALCFSVIGESISSIPGFSSAVTGISISPRKNYAVIKIWLTNCEYQNPYDITNELNDIYLSTKDCEFKQHSIS